jgi:hypothetical protein
MDRLLELLIEHWIYDIEIITTPWVWMTIVPALFYSIFMVFKWAIFLTPIWVCLMALKSTISIRKD